ncbi:MAG: AAA family ATPase [Armatimonadota bacterium]|nr:AAA family ATPase [Armatimonadota bacterium]
MILRALRLRNFRRHGDADYEFTRGLNVVVGPNEAGKSAIRDAIRVALFENAETRSESLRDSLRSWGQTDEAVVELDFEVPEGAFRVIKDFGGRRVALMGDRGRWEKNKVVQEAIGRALGLERKDVFEATAHVGQADLARLEQEGGDIASQLSRIISGADEDAARAIQRLRAVLNELERGESRQAANPGRIARVRRRVQELTAERERIERELREAQRAREQRDAGHARLREIADALADRTALLDLTRRIQHSVEQADRIRARMQEIQAKLDHVGALREALDRAREGLVSVPQVDPAELGRLRSLLRDAESLERQAASFDIQETPGPVPAPRPWLWWIAAAAVAGALLTAQTWKWLAIALGGVGLGAGWFAWHAHRARDRAVRAREAFERIREDRALRAERLRAEAARARAQVRDVMRSLGVDSLERLEEAAAQRAEREREVRSLSERIADALRGQDEDGLREERQRLAADLAAHQAFLDSDEARHKGLGALEVQKIQREQEALLTEQRDVQRTVDMLEGQLTRAPDEEDLLRVDEALAVAHDTLSRLERRREALRVALEVLEQAKAAVEVPARRAVEQRAGAFLESLTGGRYGRLRVPEGSMQIEVWSPDAGRWVRPAEPDLSRGTADLVYLAARVALVDVLAGGARPPLLFDDPFVTFDPERQTRAIAWLRELSRDRQILLFTCNDAYAAHADHVIRLGGRPTPSPASDPAQPRGEFPVQSRLF